MNYLYIFEDGSVRVGNKPKQSDIESVEDGVLQIINMRSREEYLAGQGWSDIEEIETEDEDDEGEVDFEAEDEDF